MLSENVSYNPETFKVIIDNKELDFDICEFIQTKSKYREYLQIIQKFGGYMFHQHLVEFSHKSRAAIFEDIKRMEERNLVIVKKANNFKYVMLTRKALRFLMRRNKVSPKKDIMGCNDVLMTSAYLVDIYIKYKDYRNFLLCKENNIATIYKAILELYKRNKSNNTQHNFVVSFEKRLEIEKEAKVIEKVVMLDPNAMSGNYIAGDYIGFDRAYDIKTNAGFRTIKSADKNSLRNLIKLTPTLEGMVKAEFTVLEELSVKEMSLKEYWEQQLALALEKNEKHPLVSKDSLGILAHSRIYVGYFNTIADPIKMTVNLFILDLKRSNTWLRQNLKRIDDIFAKLNYGLGRAIVDYKVIIACGSNRRKEAVNKIMSDIFGDSMRIKYKPAEQGDRLLYINSYEVENFNTERFLAFPSGNSKVPEGIKEGYINILDFRNKNVSSNFSITDSNDIDFDISIHR